MKRFIVPFTHHGNVTASYIPWTNGYAVGFRIVRQDKPDEYIYLNPSSEDDSGTPVVFVYQGPNGNPDTDMPQHHYRMDA